MNDSQLQVVRRVIGAHLRDRGELTVVTFDEAVETIISRLEKLHGDGKLDDLEDVRQLLRHERELFLADPVKYRESHHLPEGPDASEPAGTAPVMAAAPEAPPIRPAAVSAPERQAAPLSAFRMLAIATAGAAMAGLVAFLFGLAGLSCGIIVKTCYDSGWTAAANRTQSLAFQHGLGTLPSAMTIYFSPVSSGLPAYPIEYRWSDQFPGNPISVSASDDAIRLEIGGGTPLRAVWSSATGQWTKYDAGFIRVIANR
jgi:hypothetical protein